MRGNIWGLFLVALGTAWLLGELGLIDFSWSYVGPAALIVVGAGMLLGWRHRRCEGGWRNETEA